MKKILRPFLALVLAIALIIPMAMPVAADPVNLVSNGDFEGGNTGFSTDYSYVSATGWSTLQPPFVYAVGTDPYLYHSAWGPGFGDKTTGSGNMMIVNGTTSTSDPPKLVWGQEITLPVCDPVSSFPLYAGQTNLVGEVQVKNDVDGKICVKFVLNADAIAAGGLITRAHVAIADDAAGIPQVNGNPVPGQFPVNETLDPGVAETEWYCLDIGSGWTAPYAVAAHAVVEIAEISHVEDTSFSIVSDSSTLFTNYNSGDAPAPAVPAWVHPQWASQYGTSTPFGATWIWNSYRTLEPVLGEVVKFIRGFTVDGTPTAATLQITADNGYVAYMNALPVGSAQVFGAWETSNLTEPFVNSSGWSPPAEIWDVTVVPGSNTLTIVAANEYMGPDDGQADGTIESNPGAIVYKLSVTASKIVIDRPYDKDTAWGGTTDFPGKNWANYIDYTPVECSTGYVFKMWAASSYNTNPAQLQVSINGDVLGVLNLTSTTGQWEEFTATWDAGTSTTAAIAVRDLRVAYDGDDFVIDDISFVKQ